MGLVAPGAPGPAGPAGAPGAAGAQGAQGRQWGAAWSAALPYAVGDVAHYQGALFVRLVAGTTGGTPPADTSNWGPYTAAAVGALEVGGAAVTLPRRGAGSVAKVPGVTSVVTDTSSWWDAGNARYVPQVAGWYLAVAQAAVAGTSSTNVVVDIGVARNAVAPACTRELATSVAAAPSIVDTRIVAMNGTTDFLEVWGNASTQAVTTAAVSLTVTFLGVREGALPALQSAAGALTAASSAQRTLASTTAAKLVVNSVTADPSGWWDATNHRYVPRRAGVCLCIATFNGAAVQNQSWLRLAIAKNGAVVSSAAATELATSAAAGAQFSAVGVVSVNGTSDFIEVFGHSADGGTGGFGQITLQCIMLAAT